MSERDRVREWTFVPTSMRWILCYMDVAHTAVAAGLSANLYTIDR